MHIAIDTNILVQDLWMKGQRLAAFFDYIRKTQTPLLLHDVVEREVRAHFERRLAGALQTFAAARSELEKMEIGIAEVPDHEMEASREAWKKASRARLGHRPVTRIRTSMEGVGEAIERAANRLAPCSPKGSGMRDALLWIGLMEECQSKRVGELTFITHNSRDFADGAGGLKRKLEEDAKAAGVEVTVYLELDTFLRDHAAPLAHITEAWLDERIDADAMLDLMHSFANETDAQDLVPWHLREDGWTGRALKEVDFDYYLEDFYLWEYEDKDLQAFLVMTVTLRGTVECERDDSYPDGEPWRDLRTYLGEAVYSIEVAATIKDDLLDIIGIEEVQRM